MPIRPMLAATLLCVSTCFPAAVQAADYCAEAWVLRNMIFDRLGYCFGSVAGQVLFDNSDCTGKKFKPGLQQARTVGFIRDGEAQAGCQIDTTEPPSAAMRQVHAHFSRIIDLPAPDHVGGYACWGYRGPAFDLHSGASTDSPVLGTALPGQSVVTTYYSLYPDWLFFDIVTGPDGETLVSGWSTGVDIGEANCDLVAG